MVFFTECAACSMGDHEKHQSVIRPAPKGGVGGVSCPCTGDCKPRPNPFESFRGAAGGEG